MKGPREQRESTGGQTTISIIGPGMEVLGDCLADGTLRVEGTLDGTVYAGKAVVVGKDGVVRGEIRTQDAVIAGEVTGTLFAASRLEIQATARMKGDVHARRLQLEEGAILNGEVHMGEVEIGSPPSSKRKGRGAPTATAAEPRPEPSLQIESAS